LPKGVSEDLSSFGSDFDKVPALNDRRDDIPMLISHFADKIVSSKECRKSSLQQRLIC
jgi:DNA-binding NtrC family response regulator